MALEDYVEMFSEQHQGKSRKTREQRQGGLA
jgi:hypothetical protein